MNPLLAIVTLLLAFVLWLSFGTLTAAAFYSSGIAAGTVLEPAIPIITSLIPYILMFLALLFGCRFLIKIPMHRVLSDRKPFRVRMLLLSFLIQIGILALLDIITGRGLLFSSWSNALLINLLSAILLIPFQVVSEELFFRAIPTRLAFSGRLPETPGEAIPAALCCALIFSFAHTLNTGGFAPVLAYYFIWAFCASMFASASNGFEAPMGMHLGTNLYISCLVNYEGSGLPSLSLFSSDPPSLARSIIAALISFAAEYAILSRCKGRSWQSAEERKDTQQEKR